MTLALNSYSLEQYQTQQTALKQVSFNEQLLEQYSKQLDCCENSKRTYLYNIKKFLEWLEQYNNAAAIDYSVLIAYKGYLKMNYKTSAVNTSITALKDFSRYLERNGFKNYAKDIKKERISSDFKRDSLTLEQVKAIYRSIDTTTETGARANALFRLLIGTGLRECEVVRANIEDIRNIGDKTVLYIRGKGETEKNKYVVLCSSVMDSLQTYFKYRPNAKGNEALFTSKSNRNNGQRITVRTVQRIVKGLYKDNGIVNNRLTTHSTRHTAYHYC